MVLSGTSRSSAICATPCDVRVVESRAVAQLERAETAGPRPASTSFAASSAVLGQPSSTQPCVDTGIVNDGSHVRPGFGGSARWFWAKS
eukprot:3173363-Rhodomonas_salina.2